MTESRVARITQLCESWLAAAQRNDGSLGIGSATEVHRLHRNGIAFYDLNYEEIQASCIGLTRVLLLKRLNTIIDLDHQLFWAWIGELLLSPRAKVFSSSEHELKQVFEAAIRASLAGVRPPPQSKQEWEEQRRRSDSMEFNTQQLVLHAHLVLTYLAFPLLEAITKRICAAFVDYAGTVLAPFEVPQQNGQVRKYHPDEVCSSLFALLWLLYSRVADADLKQRLEEIRKHLNALDPSIDPFALIYSWRNRSLHGSASYPTIGGTVLNLATLISLNQVRATYEATRNTVWEGVQWNMRTGQFTGHRSPWSFYPPF